MSAKSNKPAPAPTTEKKAEGPKQVRLVRSASAPTIFAEGISQMVLGFPMSRLVFYQAADQDPHGDPPTELHHVACEVIMPTAAMAEAAMTVLKHMSQAKGLIDSNRADWTTRVDHVLLQLGNVKVEESASSDASKSNPT